MKMYIITCDKLINQTMEMIEYVQEKYWPSGDITVLGYKSPTYKSDTIKFNSLGIDSGPNVVCKQLHDYFSKLEDNHFIFCVDDMPLISSIDDNMIKYVVSLMKLNSNVGRFGLTLDNMQRSHTVIGRTENFNVIETVVNQVNTTVGFGIDAALSYKLSSTYSIWNRDYFLLYLNKFNNLWQWESQGSELSGQTDTWKILSTSIKIIDHAHIFKQGRVKSNWKDSAYNRITNTDIKMSDEDQTKIKEIYNL
tara:strand:+ start:273 stop:1025 length:753 start_codon:yes stop_codon:yes gene_type:complete